MRLNHLYSRAMKRHRRRQRSPRPARYPVPFVYSLGLLLKTRCAVRFGTRERFGKCVNIEQQHQSPGSCAGRSATTERIRSAHRTRRRVAAILSFLKKMCKSARLLVGLIVVVMVVIPFIVMFF